jgi:hypothetical protein
MMARQERRGMTRQDEAQRGPQRISEILPFVLARVGLSQTPPGGEAEARVIQVHPARSSCGTVRRTVSFADA